MEINRPQDRKVDVEPTRISVILSDELLQRLESVPDQQGQALRYRFSREMLARLSDVILLFPAPAHEIKWKQVSIPVDFNQDLPWLPLLTHRLLPRPKEEEGGVSAAEKEQLISSVASALHNLGGTKAESMQAAKDHYRAGDDFESLFKKSLGRGRG